MNIPKRAKELMDETRKLEAKYKELFQDAADEYGSAAKLSNAMGMSTSYIANAIAQPSGLIAKEKTAKRLHKFFREMDAA